MSKRFRIIAPAVTFAVVAGLLYAQQNPQSELAGTLEKLQRQIKDLQSQTKALEDALRQLRKSAGKSAKSSSPTESLPAAQTAPALLVPASAEAANPQTDFQKSLESFRLGIQLEDQRNYRAAIDAYSQTIRFDPKNDTAFLRRGDCYLQLSDNEKALADLSQSLTIQPDNSRAYVLRATAYAALGKDQLAMGDLNEAMVRDPNNPDSLLLRGHLYQLEGDHQRAASDYTVALSLNPNSEAAFLGRAASLRNQGLMPLALSDCDNAVRVNPSSPAGYLCRAESFNRTGAPDRAIEQLNQAMVAAQMLHQPLTSLNNLLVQTIANSAPPASARVPVVISASQNNPPVGLPIPRSAPSSAPAEPQILPPSVIPSPLPPIVVTLPPTEARNSAPQPPLLIRPPKAAPAIAATPTAVVDSNSGTGSYFERLAREHLREEQFASAAKSFDQSVAADPNRATAFNGRGFAYLRLKNFPQAVSDFSNAIRLNPDYLNAFHNRAVARRLTGDNAGAFADGRKEIEILRSWQSAGKSSR